MNAKHVEQHTRIYRPMIDFCELMLLVTYSGDNQNERMWPATQKETSLIPPAASSAVTMNNAEYEHMLHHKIPQMHLRLKFKLSLKMAILAVSQMRPKMTIELLHDMSG